MPPSTCGLVIAGELSEHLEQLRQAKEQQEKALEEQLSLEKQQKAEQEAALKQQIGKLQEVQEKALGVATKPLSTGAPPPPNRNAARSRAALYSMAIARAKEEKRQLKQP